MRFPRPQWCNHTRHYASKTLSGPLYQYLAECAIEYGGVIHEEGASVKSYDVKNKIMHNDTQLAVYGDFYWGRCAEPIAKYQYMRYLNGKS